MYGGMYGSSDPGRARSQKSHTSSYQRQRIIQKTVPTSRSAKANCQSLPSGQLRTEEIPTLLSSTRNYPTATVRDRVDGSLPKARPPLKSSEKLPTAVDRAVDADDLPRRSRASSRESSLHKVGSRLHLTLVERIANFLRRTWIDFTATEGMRSR